MNEISSHLQQDGPYIYILLTDLLCMNSHHKRTSDSTFDFNSISIWKSLNTCENAEDKPTGRGYNQVSVYETWLPPPSICQSCFQDFYEDKYVQYTPPTLHPCTNPHGAVIVN